MTTDVIEHEIVDFAKFPLEKKDRLSSRTTSERRVIFLKCEVVVKPKMLGVSGGVLWSDQ